MSNNQYQQTYPQVSEQQNSSLLTQQVYQQQPQQQQQYTQQQVYQQQPQQQQQVYQQQFQQPVNPMNGSSSSWAQPGTTEPIIIFLCNLFFPGLGHILLGQVTKGILIIVSWIVLYTTIIVLSSFLIGLIFIPLLIVHMGIVLYDGQVLADRVKRGYPIMQEENSTSWMKMINFFRGFNHNNINECPQEWISKQQQTNQARQQQQ
eukprot:gene12095-5588_t